MTAVLPTTTEPMPPFFWLHIRKSAGQSTRAVLHETYAQSCRRGNIQNFPESPPSEWNDVLNNHRVPLGRWQFRRCIYARDFIYREHWDKMVRFAFSRDPLERCISGFFYLDKPGYRGGLLSRSARLPIGPLRRTALNHRFDRHLGKIEACLASPVAEKPHGVHFATHTAPMWPDIVDEDGNILLSHVFDLRDFDKGIALVHELCGLQPPPRATVEKKTNVNARRMPFTPTRQQIARVEKIYERDFTLHHDHLHRFD
ncbi:sulfotransferase family protein [Roseibacterium beibuensis]|uniref:Sulfotransferase family protein n=1 Tax=[Roseibacterium] beibuensis TaxID=1193142 RepID=A0ABP9L1T0_9RHOB|nr:sulfotransferase family protein [Roseibacterium beibuensis]MCS6621750.1 sulfotransferase family protein [Roseibacterium beibuensis]